MASTFRQEREGLSNGRPPYFDGDHYSQWKMRMRLHLMALDMALWNVVEDGPHVPTMTIEKDGKKETVVATKEYWNEEDNQKMSLNAKAMSILLNALSSREANHVASCGSAKDMWKRLEVKHEGTSKVKETKINRLLRDYELFEMLPNESISDMETRLSNLLNALESLGRIFPEKDKVQKILRSLPEEYDSKATAIEEAKDLDALTMEELCGTLMVHEKTLLARQEKKNGKKKNIALATKETVTKSSKSKREKEKVMKDESDSEMDSTDEEIIMMARKFKKFFNKKKKGMSKGMSKNKEKNSDGRGFPKTNRDHHIKKKVDEEPTCYKCHKVGHMKGECPMWKKEIKRKAFKATWDDSSDSENDESSGEEEMASLCLMAKNDSSLDEEVNSESPLDNDDDDVDMSYEDLYEMFTNLHTKYRIVKKEKKTLSKQNASLLDTLKRNSRTIHDQDVCIQELNSKLNIAHTQSAIMIQEPYEHVESMDELKLKLDVLQDQYDELKFQASMNACDDCELKDLEIDVLREECESIAKSFEKFNHTSLTLEQLLRTLKLSYDKGGIGYDYTNDDFKLKDPLPFMSKGFIVPMCDTCHELDSLPLDEHVTYVKPIGHPPIPIGDQGKDMRNLKKGISKGIPKGITRSLSHQEKGKAKANYFDGYGKDKRHTQHIQHHLLAESSIMGSKTVRYPKGNTMAESYPKRDGRNWNLNETKRYSYIKGKTYRYSTPSRQADAHPRKWREAVRYSMGDGPSKNLNAYPRRKFNNSYGAYDERPKSKETTSQRRVNLNAKPRTRLVFEKEVKQIWVPKGTKNGYV